MQETEQSEPNIDAAEICEQAKIFKKEPISRYHSAINDAAATICLKTPSMLTKRADLLALARKSVDESGFLYTKGKSRSKAFGSEAGEGLPLRKRPKISQEFRETRRENITEDLNCINTQIQFKERRIETEATSKNFKMCDLLSEEVAELKKKRQLLESELLYSSKRRKSRKCTTEGRRNSTHLVIVMPHFQTLEASLEAQEVQLAHHLHLALLCFCLRVRLPPVVKIPELAHLQKQSFFQELNQVSQKLVLLSIFR